MNPMLYRINEQLVTFADYFNHSRASVATYFDGNGVLQTATADTPRINHHVYNAEADAWEPVGLLHEPHGTYNAIPDSLGMTGPEWAHQGYTLVPQQDPAGGSNAMGLSNYTQEGTLSATALLPDGFIENDNTGTFSIFIKLGTHPYMRLLVYGATSEIELRENLNACTSSQGRFSSPHYLSFAQGEEPFGAGYERHGEWIRIYASCRGLRFITLEFYDGDHYAYYQSSPTGPGEFAATLFGPQVERFSSWTFPSDPTRTEIFAPPMGSYIPTSGTPATRAGDVLAVKRSALVLSGAEMSVALKGTIRFGEGVKSNSVATLLSLPASTGSIEMRADTSGAPVDADSVPGSARLTVTLGEGASSATITSNDQLIPMQRSAIHAAARFSGGSLGAATGGSTFPSVGSITSPDLSAATADMAIGVSERAVMSIERIEQWATDIGATAAEVVTIDGSLVGETDTGVQTGFQVAAAQQVNSEATIPPVTTDAALATQQDQEASLDLSETTTGGVAP